MTQMTFEQAISSTIVAEMAKDPTIFMFGWPEGADILESGPSAEDAVKQFGRERLMYTGINEM
jgi:pyruvate/2-oxoglutarate/acetoin dehydrogenase E1 component